MICRLHNAAVLLVSCSLLGCGLGSKEAEDAMTPQPPGLPGVYAGEFPCSNCDSIGATLWLREDGRFFLRQRYVGGEDAGPSSYALGRWHWDEGAAQLVLTSPGPERRFTPDSEQRLRLQTVSPTPYVLARDVAAPVFADRVRLDGDSVIVDRAAAFTECLTGLRFDVVETSGYKELRRQHRLLNSRGAAALTTVEGHLKIGDDGRELLVIDRVIGLKPGAHC
jgi:hypothetical protein